MQAIKCEMCGGNDLVKQDGLFVCQNCGTKYTVEEAKKLIINGKVDVSGSTVKIDTSNELENLYQIARRAKDENNGENASKYYDMILVKDPNSWEAAFYTVYFKAMECKIIEIQSAAIAVENCVVSVIDLIKKNLTDETEKNNAVEEVVAHSMIISDMLYNGAKNHYEGIDYLYRPDYTPEMLYNCCAARDILYTLGNQLEAQFPGEEEIIKQGAVCWINAIGKHNEINVYFKDKGKEANKKIMLYYIDKVKKYLPDYKAPAINMGSKGGCYVATAVYGSYDCPEVWVLRRFRDDVLAETLLGRAFIHTYYAISPTLVKWFGATAWFKKMWQHTLDFLVANLKDKGFSDKPYNDKQW